MDDRSSKRSGNRTAKRGKGTHDVNVRAWEIVQQATGEMPKEQPPEKNPAAVSLGRLGGLKGGRARAEKLSATRRRAIARKGARARWKNQK